MTVTDILIAWIQDGLPSDDGHGHDLQATQDEESDLVSKAGDTLGHAADLAQLAPLLLATSPTGVGALAAFLFSFAAGITIELASSDLNSDNKILQDIDGKLDEVKNAVGRGNWSSKMDEIGTYSIPVNTDRDIVRHGCSTSADGQIINSTQVVKDQVPFFVTHSQQYITFFTQPPTNSTVWYRSYAESLTFKPLQAPLPAGDSVPLGFIEWYGNIPKPEVDHDDDGNEIVFDPQYTLPTFLYAIEWVIQINGLLNQINPTYPKFTDYLIEYRDDFADWAVNTLIPNYERAVRGLVKSDLPSDDDIIGMLSAAGVQGFSGGSQTVYHLGAWPEGSAPRTGFSWNLVHGVVDIYAVFHQEHIPLATPSGIISDRFHSHSMRLAVTPSHTCPWVRARVQLRLMAQWKALYFIKGYDKALSVIQSLLILGNQQPYDVPTVDGMKANGDWSIRELSTILNKILQPYYESLPPHTVDGVPIIIGPEDDNYVSLRSLTIALDIIAKGDWSGPAKETNLNGSVSLQDQLTAAAGFVEVG